MSTGNFGQTPPQQDPEYLVGQAARLLGQGRHAEAAKLSHDLLKKFPKEPSVLYFASENAMIAGDLPAALELVTKAVDKAPERPVLHMQQARILIGLRRRRDARKAAVKAADLLPQNVKMLKAVGSMLSQCEDFEAANGVFEKALKLVPGDPTLLFDLATTQFFLGDMDEAEESISAILKVRPENGAAVHLRSILRKRTKKHNHIDMLETKIAEGLKNWEASMYFNFALAKECEDLGEYDKSFSALEKGAKIRRQHLNYDEAGEHANINDIMKHYTLSSLEEKTIGCEEQGPIFIVGMPRTGTTLVERILGNHSKVTSAGELSDFPMAMTDQIQKTLANRPNDNLSGLEASLVMNFKELGENYLNSARQTVGPSPYFVDKLPFNFLYCGLIRKALPNAKIIHLVRDPMDSCYAIYKTLFNQVYSFSYDLDELGNYYVLYRQLMDHWHKVMPGEILDVAYEDVVHDSEIQARRIMDWCGLPWEASVLDFHSSKAASSTASAAQIRQPIYTSSVQKWRNYDRQLTSLKKKLVAAGLASVEI